MATNPNFEWQVVLKWFTEGSVLKGLQVTLGLTVVSMVLGTLLVCYWASGSSVEPVAARRCRTRIWLLSWHAAAGTADLLVQPFYAVSGAVADAAVDRYHAGQLEYRRSDRPLTAAIAGLALNEAAYMAEIIRAGLLSVDNGSGKTTQAFGMSRSRALRRIIIPQAMRSIIPPTGNRLISMIKATSLVSVIAMGDLLYSGAGDLPTVPSRSSRC